MSEVRIADENVSLPGDLEVPPDPAGLVIFAHGSGSSRLSSRNRRVASDLRSSGRLGTLLFDLLTPEEDTEYANRFDIPLLAQRLLLATRFVRAQPGLLNVPFGYFGASTGAAAALVAAAQLSPQPAAVVSRGGRPDLAGSALRLVRAPVLLIVGGNDEPVIGMNREAFAQIPAAEKRIDIVPGATHLFEEPGALEEVSRLAVEWFETHLSARTRA
jgi:putative phosphoribosyl transferase